MNKSIRAFAPATCANVACGFDVLGFAVDNPGDEVTITLNDSGKITIKSIIGDEGKLPLDPEENTVSLVIKKYLEHIGKKQGLEIELVKKMPLKSGLGSSAASSVVGVYALNELLGRPLKVEELLPFAMEGERLACGSAHADNVAPALLGGFVLVRSYEPLDVVKLPTPENLWATIIHPHIEVKTKDARQILRQKIELKDAVVQWGNVGGLIAGLMMKDYALIGRSLQDVIVEPIRSILIPGFYQAKQAALENGALGSSISGSGPSIFALSDDKSKAENIGKAMKSVYDSLNIEAEVYVSKVSEQGPRVIS
jgi:homoserine kinase